MGCVEVSPPENEHMTARAASHLLNMAGKGFLNSGEAAMSYGDQGYGDGGGRGFPVRWIIALVIAAIGIVGYMFRTEENPVTHERQHIGMSVYAGEGPRPPGGARDGPEDGRRHRRVATRGPRSSRRSAGGSSARSDASGSPYVDNFHFHLLNDPKTINAFALPGGQIFITKALFEKLDNEAELAGVLGHEIGHVINRHSAQQMATGQLGQMLAMAVGVGASDDRGHGQAAAMAAQMANQMMQLQYSREDESQADEYGLKYMAQAGYDPKAMLDVMHILKESSKGGSPPEILATHPLPETRLQEIAAKLKEMYPEGIPADLSDGRSLKGGIEGRERGGNPYDKVFKDN